MLTVRFTEDCPAQSIQLTDIKAGEIYELPVELVAETIPVMICRGCGKTPCTIYSTADRFTACQKKECKYIKATIVVGVQKEGAKNELERSV